MKQFTLRLDEKQQRPVVSLAGNLTALLDTGAFMPVWTDDESILETELGAKLIKKNVPFSGFGGETKGNVYQVTLTVGELIFPHMHIIANDELGVPFDLILSATMFHNLIYEIDNKNHKLNVTVPDDESTVRTLMLKDSNGRLHVLCHSAEEETAESYNLSSDNKVNEKSANIAAAYRNYRSDK